MIKYACVNTRKSRASIPEKLEIRKSQDLAKDFGGTASKAEKEICKSKMKTKRKKKRKKRREKNYMRIQIPDLRHTGLKALPLGHVEHTSNLSEILLLKPSSPLFKPY